MSERWEGYGRIGERWETGVGALMRGTYKSQRKEMVRRWLAASGDGKERGKTLKA